MTEIKIVTRDDPGQGKIKMSDLKPLEMARLDDGTVVIRTAQVDHPEVMRLSVSAGGKRPGPDRCWSRPVPDRVMVTALPNAVIRVYPDGEPEIGVSPIGEEVAGVASQAAIEYIRKIGFNIPWQGRVQDGIEAAVKNALKPLWK